MPPDSEPGQGPETELPDDVVQRIQEAGGDLERVDDWVHAGDAVENDVFAIVRMPFDDAVAAARFLMDSVRRDGEIEGDIDRRSAREALSEISSIDEDTVYLPEAVYAELHGEAHHDYCWLMVEDRGVDVYEVRPGRDLRDRVDMLPDETVAYVFGDVFSRGEGFTTFREGHEPPEIPREGVLVHTKEPLIFYTASDPEPATVEERERLNLKDLQLRIEPTATGYEITMDAEALGVEDPDKIGYSELPYGVSILKEGRQIRQVYLGEPDNGETYRQRGDIVLDVRMGASTPPEASP